MPRRESVQSAKKPRFCVIGGIAVSFQPIVPDLDNRQPLSMTLEATVIRADGTIEPLGIVAYWHQDPEKRQAAKDSGIAGTFRSLPDPEEE